MSLFTALRRIFRRPEAVDVAPGVNAIDQGTSDMAQLAEKMAAKRGDNISVGSAQSSENASERLASNARDVGIVSSTREDNVLSGRNEKPLI